MSSNVITPNHREILAAQSTITGKAEYLTSTNHVLNSSAIISGSAIPIAGATTAVAVGIVDGSGNQITSFGGGTQYTDGAAPPAHPIGPTLEFNNAGTWATVGSATPLPVTGSLTIGGTTDNSAFTAGTSTGTPAMGFYHSSIDTVTDGRAAAVGITSKRAMLVTLQTSAGADTGVAAVPLQVSLANTGANTNKLLVTPDSVALPANQSVNISQINGASVAVGHGVAATALRVELPTDGTGVVGLNAGTAIIGKVGIDQTTPGTTNAVSANQGAAAALASGWPVINGEASDTTGTFTNATQSTSVTAGSLDGYGNVLISITGTYGTATAVFEGSDDGGTTWYGISEADRTDSNVIESGYTSLTNTSRAWQISNPGWDSVRVRSTAVASGTVNVRISPSAAPTSAGASVSIGVALPAGSAIVGKVGIDQTTPGTTNLVALSAETTKVIGTVNQGTNPWVTSNATTSVVGNGAAATAQRVTIANDSTGIVALTTSAAVIGKLAANGGTIIGDVNVVSEIPGVGATNLGKAEDAAHTTGDTGIGVMGVRNDTLAAQTNANTDYGFHAIDQAGILITSGAPRALKGRQATTITSSTAETTIISSVASTFLDLYGLILANTSASTTKVSIRDATAGGTITVLEVPAGDTRGFMLPLDSAVPQAAVTNNWTAQSSVSITSLEVTALFVKRV